MLNCHKTSNYLFDNSVFEISEFEEMHCQASDRRSHAAATGAFMSWHSCIFVSVLPSCPLGYVEFSKMVFSTVVTNIPM